MLTEQIGELFVGIKAKIDKGSFKGVEAFLKGTERKMRALEAKLGPNAKAYKAHQQQQAQAFKQQMQASKFSLASKQAEVKLATAQDKQAISRIKAQSMAAAEARRADKHAVQQQAAKLRIQGQQLTNQRKQVSLEAAKGRLDAQNERRARLAARAQKGSGFFAGGLKYTGRQSGRGVGGMMGRMTKAGGSNMIQGVSGGGVRQFGKGAAQMGVGAAGSVLGAGAGIALSGLTSAATLAAQALTAVAVASVAFLSMAQQSQDRQNMREAQFRAAAINTKNDPAQAAVMEQRFQTMADTLGLNTQDVGKDYSRAVSGLAPQMGLNDTQTFLNNLLAFGKSQGASNEEVQRGLTAIGQMAGKGQMMSEELKGQLAEAFGPQTMSLMAEAWAKTSNNGLTGQKAIAQLTKDMEKGLVKGAQMIGALEQFGTLAYSKAQEGGALATAQNTQESQRNRLANQWERTRAEAFRSTGGKGMGDAMGGLTDLLKAAQPQFNQLAQSGQYFANALGQALKYVAEIVTLFNNGGMWSFADKMDIPATLEFFSNVKSSFDQLFQVFGAVAEVVKDIFDPNGDGGSGFTSFLTGVVDVLAGMMSMVEYMVRIIGVGVKAFNAWKNDDKSFSVSAAMDEAFDKSLGERNRIVEQRERKRAEDEKWNARIKAEALPGEQPGITSQRLKANDAAMAYHAQRKEVEGQAVVPMPTPTNSIANQVMQMSKTQSQVMPSQDTSGRLLAQVAEEFKEAVRAKDKGPTKIDVQVPLTINIQGNPDQNTIGDFEKAAERAVERAISGSFSNQTQRYQ